MVVLLFVNINKIMHNHISEKYQQYKAHNNMLLPYRAGGEYNLDEIPQYFQISVNILEAKKLAWSSPHSSNSYVIVVLAKKKYRTTIKKNSVDPLYRQHFIFEMYMSIQELQRSSVWLAVMEPRCCSPPCLIGEANVDLGAVWEQPHHRVFHKWAQLTQPHDSVTGPVGFLKVDICIIFRADIQAMPTIVNDNKIQDNLLLPTGSEQQCANFLITIHGAFSLPSGANCNSERRYGKPPSTFVRVTFCGLTAKTAVQYRTSNPIYSEQISFVELFPNMSQLVQFEVCSADGCFKKVLGSCHLSLGQISHDGDNGYLPTYGPSLLHMYSASSGNAMGTAFGEDGPYHRGTLLASLKTIVPYSQQGVRSVNVEPVAPVQTDNLWLLEEFCVFCPILEISMLNRRMVNKICGVALTIGEIPSAGKADEGFAAMSNEIKTHKLHYTGSLDVMKSRPAYGYVSFNGGFPVLQLATRLPDFRFRMYRNNMIYEIVLGLESIIEDAERRLVNFEYNQLNELADQLNKALDDAAGNILKFLDIVQYLSPTGAGGEDMMQRYSTELDQKQLALQKEEIEKIYQQIINRNKNNSVSNLILSLNKSSYDRVPTRKGVKLLLADIKSLAQSLKKLIYKNNEGWPDLVIWLLNNGSRIAYSKIQISDIIYSIIPEQNGRLCGRIQSIFLKPLKCSKHTNTPIVACHCIAGKVELLLWMGLHRQRAAFEDYIPTGYRVKIRDYDMCLRCGTMMVECRIFVYRAKFNGNPDKFNLPNSFVRVNVFSTIKETKIKQKTLTPVWNQVLKMQKMIASTMERLIIDPPVIFVEVYNNDSNKVELIGNFEMKPLVDDRQGYEHAPKLQWYDVYKSTENTGQLLISAQILQIPEKLLKSTVYSPVEEIYYSELKDMCIEEEDLEILPTNLIPKTTSYKVDIYWWGLRELNTTRKPCVTLEIEELTIKSDVVADKRSNTNFPNGRVTQIFEAPLSESYSPPLKITLYDSGTFGRTVFLGSTVVKNPNKYIINWLPKTEREVSLKTVSIASMFSQVSQRMYAKKSISSVETNDAYSNKSDKSSMIISKSKYSNWRRLFCRSEVSEEECTLLPMFAKERDYVVKSSSYAVEEDWWLRYSCSQKDDIYDSNTFDTKKITIYDSELENQPQFSKFKDWCKTLKLYNGRKCGIPDKDEQLFCGYLKAGIAIYNWPPPRDTVAVSSSGVDLCNGYFDDYPKNDTAKFLVRVYMIRGMNLTAKDFTGTSDPYVVLNCGNKRLGDRNVYLSNNANPIFGRTYEFRCTLPEDYLLTVSLYNYDSIGADELIGSTSIDIEDRIYSKHKALVGLAPEYNLSGPNKWRDCRKPSAILEELCLKNHLPQPIYPNKETVLVNGIQYKNYERKDKTYLSMSECKENICLSLLHKWHTLPICGYHLVPEHVETRTLFKPNKTGTSHGKIQMWIDIFPLESGIFIPPAVDIAPPKVEDFELRVIVWDVYGIKSDESNTTEKRPMDIYVKACIGVTEQEQNTDIHHRSERGEGKFNWRMIFHFQYQHAVKKLVIKEKGPFIEYEESMPPILIVQVLDSEAHSTNEFLGALTLNLNAMPRGVKSAQLCTLEALDRTAKINLFAKRSVRAWWPLNIMDLNTGNATYAGAINLEMTLLPKEKAILMPVGFGRAAPSPLPEPKRRSSKLCKVTQALSENSVNICLVVTVIVMSSFTLLAAVAMLFDIPEMLAGWIVTDRQLSRRHGFNSSTKLRPLHS